MTGSARTDAVRSGDHRGADLPHAWAVDVLRRH
jgi:hypothetical protein